MPGNHLTGSREPVLPAFFDQLSGLWIKVQIRSGYPYQGHKMQRARVISVMMSLPRYLTLPLIF